MNEYGISCIIAIRTINGIIECGPYAAIKDIPEAYYAHFVWLSIKDHNNEEMIYIRGRDANGDIRTQLISQSNVVFYTYYSDEDISLKILNELLVDVIAQYGDKSTEYMDRLQAVQKSLI